MPLLPAKGKTPTLEEERAARDLAECSSCKAPIYWVTLSTGKRHPVERGRETRVSYVDGEWRVLGSYVSHFAKCPNAAQHRKS